MLKMHINNQKGVGVLLVLLVFAVVGAVSIYVLRLESSTTKILTLNNQKSSYRNLVKSVRASLSVGKGCSEALGLNTGTGLSLLPLSNVMVPYLNQDPNILGMRLPQGIKFNYGPKILGPIKYQPNLHARFRIPGGTAILDVRLSIDSDRIIRDYVHRAIPGDTRKIARYGKIHLVPEHGGIKLTPLIKTVGGVTTTYERDSELAIPIIVYYEPSTNKLVDCFDFGGAAHTCTILGGTYDTRPTTPESNRCHPDMSCRVHKVGVVNNPALCVSPYVPRSVGGGLYNCMWCNPNIHP